MADSRSKNLGKHSYVLLQLFEPNPDFKGFAVGEVAAGQSQVDAVDESSPSEVDQDPRILASIYWKIVEGSFLNEHQPFTAIEAQ